MFFPIKVIVIPLNCRKVVMSLLNQRYHQVSLSSALSNRLALNLSSCHLQSNSCINSDKYPIAYNAKQIFCGLRVKRIVMRHLYMGILRLLVYQTKVDALDTPIRLYQCSARSFFLHGS